MKIHRAGVNVILSLFILEAILLAVLHFLIGIPKVTYIFTGSLVLLLLFVIRFFRKPVRNIAFKENEVISPADGKVVVIERIEDKQFSGENRIQVSIFMSVWNIHINWIPVIGKILNTEHINGKFLIAKQPKSSLENERTVTQIESSFNKSNIVVKQIAGTVARRIITYARKGMNAEAGNELGFIRFGSRVDVLLPEDSKIFVKLGQKVTGGESVIGELVK